MGSPPTTVVEFVDQAARKRPRKPQPSERATWFEGCVVDDRDRIIPNLANVLVALRNAPQIADAFAFDAMLSAPILTKALPLAQNGESASADPLPRPVHDSDVSQLQEWLQHQGMPKIGKDQVHQAVDQRAMERAFHPVRAYLRGLQWDKTHRLDDWLSTYLGAPKDAYAARVGRMFLVAMVARIFEPGCKADHLIVLEGKQGVGKSTACRILAGEWFSDNMSDIHTKDAMQHLRGRWLIELAELSAIRKADMEALKSFIARQTEGYRPAYGRKEVIEPRQCVFVGTTNQAAYLKDETGARRFWPVKVGKIDANALARDRDQLFAEAVGAYRAGEEWWPDARFEREHIKPEQEKRFDGDPWEAAIERHVESLTRVTVTELATDCLRFEPKQIGQTEQQRIARVLISLGWISGRTKTGRFYTKPGDR